MTPQKRKRAIDSIWGFAIGDALGVPYEFQKNPNVKKLEMVGYGTHDQPPGTWSDDTSLLLACLDSEKSRQSLWTNYKRILDGHYSIDGLLFDIGHGTAESLKNDKPSIHYLSSCEDESKGNGCLCRTIPHALGSESPIGLGAENFLLHEDISITHNNSSSTICAAIMSDILFDIYEGEEVFLSEDETQLKGKSVDGYVYDSLSISLAIGLTCFSYEEGVLRAINLGGDTDSHAAFVGAIAGARFGVPEKFKKKLRGQDMIQNIINKSVWLK